MCLASPSLHIQEMHSEYYSVGTETTKSSSSGQDLWKNTSIKITVCLCNPIGFSNNLSIKEGKGFNMYYIEVR